VQTIFVRRFISAQYNGFQIGVQRKPSFQCKIGVLFLERCPSPFKEALLKEVLYSLGFFEQKEGMRYLFLFLLLGRLLTAETFFERFEKGFQPEYKPDLSEFKDEKVYVGKCTSKENPNVLQARLAPFFLIQDPYLGSQASFPALFKTLLTDFDKRVWDKAREMTAQSTPLEDIASNAYLSFTLNRTVDIFGEERPLTYVQLSAHKKKGQTLLLFRFLRESGSSLEHFQSCYFDKTEEPPTKNFEPGLPKHFLSNGDGTFTEIKTKRLWSKISQDVYEGSYANNFHKQYCSQLSASKGGTWRAPKLAELSDALFSKSVGLLSFAENSHLEKNTNVLTWLEDMSRSRNGYMDDFFTATVDLAKDVSSAAYFYVGSFHTGGKQHLFMPLEKRTYAYSVCVKE
jgi:hypothetical protein